MNKVAFVEGNVDHQVALARPPRSLPITCGGCESRRLFDNAGTPYAFSEAIRKVFGQKST